MKTKTCVIFCGGKGTRLEDVTDGKIPKPLVPINGKPLMYHLMKYYMKFGVKDFILAAGHQQIEIKKFARDFDLYSSEVYQKRAKNNGSVSITDVNITVVDTGEETQTSGRLARIEKYLTKDTQFFLTYGDGLANVNLRLLEQKFCESNYQIMLTGITPPGRFGDLLLEGDGVKELQEKSDNHQHWINGGFMICRNDVFKFLSSHDADTIPFETGPLPELAKLGALGVHRHTGYWQCCDNLRDWRKLNKDFHDGLLNWLA